MHEAFEILGLRSLHSGYAPLARPPACNYVFGNGSFSDVLPLLRSYDTAGDEPYQLLYEEVLTEFPNAKFVMPVTDPETWYQSYLDFFASDILSESATGTALLQHGAARHLQRGINDMSDTLDQCSAAKYLGCNFEIAQTPELKQKCLDGFNNHVASVKEKIPADKLLLFNFSEGWTPLCDFLGKPVPTEPFPRVDKFHDTEESLIARFAKKTK